MAGNRPPKKTKAGRGRCPWRVDENLNPRSWNSEGLYAQRRPVPSCTLAHELAHAVLHRRIFLANRFGRVEDWKRFQRTLDEADRGWLEYQAYAFAGLILVPTEPLLAEYQKALRVAGRAGLSLQSAGEGARPYIANWLARRFDVSSQVIEKRLNKDDLWP
jgi:Zn-dependent peptidase ImmA (M78 family)